MARKRKASQSGVPSEMPAHLVSRPVLTRQGIAFSTLAQLGLERITEAKLLLRNRHPSGAAYLVGYGVELLLKSIIASKNFGGFWPIEQVDAHLRHHDLEVLLRQAGLEHSLRSALRTNRPLAINWIVVRSWRPHLRYMRVSENEGRDMVGAVADKPNGVGNWLSFWADGTGVS